MRGFLPALPPAGTTPFTAQGSFRPVMTLTESFTGARFASAGLRSYPAPMVVGTSVWLMSPS